MCFGKGAGEIFFLGDKFRLMLTEFVAGLGMFAPVGPS